MEHDIADLDQRTERNDSTLSPPPIDDDKDNTLQWGSIAQLTRF